MQKDVLRRLLEDVKDGRLSPDDVLNRLRTLPYDDLDFAKLDNHRALRKGYPEVIFGQGKTKDQIMKLIDSLIKNGNDAIVTRTDRTVYNHIKKKYKEAIFNEKARIILLRKAELKNAGRGSIMVISAGTSDIPVAEEAAFTAEIFGNKVERLYDVGVAGIHRLFDKLDILMSASVLIVVAGMEGALPSVVGGLVEGPVIAVPTSIGYGASFGGITALLAMLNSCSSNVAVVNIDNGFGAGYIASVINRK
ncbi:MAG: nickel pincer cofactor biosynthesis protein LarB [Thermodesulfovibrionales bacterium]